MPLGVANNIRLTDPFPISIARAAGSRKWDVDGNEYIDYMMGSAALLLGHAHPAVNEAIAAQLQRGTHYAQPHALEAEWGELIQQLVPSIEQLRFTNSGTEANMMALMLARAFTGKRKVLRFEGHFHGTLPVGILGQKPPFYPLRAVGVPESVAENYVVLPATDETLVEQTLVSDPEIAAVILEPSGASWGLVPLPDGFLGRLRRITSELRVLLIFDEVITGFRWSPGGAQAVAGVSPDLTTLAKIAAGGLPGGVVGGRAEIMATMDPSGPVATSRGGAVFQGGTFNGNPLTAAAAIATLRIAATAEPQRQADHLAADLRNGLNEIIRDLGLPGVAYGDSSTFHMFFGKAGDTATTRGTMWTQDAAEIKGMSPRLVDAVHHALQNRGVDLMSRMGGVVSSAHTQADIDRTLAAVEASLRAVSAEHPEFFA
jgi:glutamate-1-semialdehyde 2,1-aminomutase